MKRILLALLVTLPLFAQTTRTKQIVIRCASSSRLSVSGESVIYKKCSDGKTYISKDGGAFAELTDTAPTATVKGVKVTNSAGINLADSTDTALTWDTEAVDDDTFHSTVTNTSRFTAPSNGWHLVTGTIQYGANSTGNRQCLIRLNGTTSVGFAMLPAATAANSGAVQCVALLYLSATDYVELVAYQNSGGTLTTQPATAFSMVRY